MKTKIDKYHVIDNIEHYVEELNKMYQLLANVGYPPEYEDYSTEDWVGYGMDAELVEWGPAYTYNFSACLEELVGLYKRNTDYLESLEKHIMEMEE